MTEFFFSDTKVIAIKNLKEADAQRIGESISEIEQEFGEVKPEILIERAKDPDHPAHPHFDWDDREAGYKWRLVQARAIIRIIVTVEPATKMQAPAFVSIKASEGVSYRSIGEVISSGMLTDCLLEQAEGDLRAFEMRYRQFIDLVEKSRELRELVSKKRSSLKRPPPGTHPEK
jgi:hypothetical protein